MVVRSDVSIAIRNFILAAERTYYTYDCRDLQEEKHNTATKVLPDRIELPLLPCKGSSLPLQQGSIHFAFIELPPCPAAVSFIFTFVSFCLYIAVTAEQTQIHQLIVVGTSVNMEG